MRLCIAGSRTGGPAISTRRNQVYCGLYRVMRAFNVSSLSVSCQRSHRPAYYPHIDYLGRRFSPTTFIRRWHFVDLDFAFPGRRNSAIRLASRKPGHTRISSILMFDHVGFGVSNYASSKTFFLKEIAPLGGAVVMEGPYGLGLGWCGKASLWKYQTEQTPARRR